MPGLRSLQPIMTWSPGPGANGKESLDAKTVIMILVQLLSRKAIQFFMEHVADNRNKWTTKSVYEGLFNHNFKLELRENESQGNLTV